VGVNRSRDSLFETRVQASFVFVALTVCTHCTTFCFSISMISDSSCQDLNGANSFQLTFLIKIQKINSFYCLYSYIFFFKFLYLKKHHYRFYM